MRFESLRVTNVLFIYTPTPFYIIAFLTDVYINLILGTFSAGVFISLPVFRLHYVFNKLLLNKVNALD